MKSLVESYHPQTLKQIVGNKDIIKQLQHMVDTKDLQNLIITGCSGCGKSSSIFAIIRETGAEYIELNASDERNISTIRSTIKTFAMKKSFLPKIIVLEEIDNMPKGSQHGIVSLIEESNACFILTCNDYDKIVENLSSRCMILKFKALDDEDIIKRLAKICKDHLILYEDKVLQIIATRSEGDLRRAINLLQTCFLFLDDNEKLLTEQILYNCSSEPSGKIIQNIINSCLNKNYSNAFNDLENLLQDGYDSSDIISFLFKECSQMEFEQQIPFLKTIGEYHLNILRGGSKLQLFSLLISLIQIQI